MMRRATLSAGSAAASARTIISSYEFGHPNMGTEFLPKTHYPAKKEVGTVAAGARVSRLPNGSRIITHDRNGAQSAIGVYFEAGAKYDPVSAPGLSYVLRHALRGSNMENSMFQLDRSARVAGASTDHTEIRKRFVGIKFEVGGNWERVAQDHFATIAAPRFNAADIDRFRDHMDNVLSERRWQEPREYAIDQLETVAFYREALGNPRFVAPELNDKSTLNAVLDQWCRYAIPSRVVISAVNVDHDSLIAAYENSAYAHSASAPHHANAGAIPADGSKAEREQYFAGNERVEPESRPKAMSTKPDGEEEAIFALGFLAPGADDNVKQYAAALVTRELAAISFGESVAPRHQPHHGIESFYRPFSSAGLIGATIRSAPGDAKAGVLEAAKAIRGVSAENIKAAQARAAARFFDEHIERTGNYVDFLAASLVTDSLNRVSAEDVLSAIDGADASAIATIVKGVQAQRPCLFGTGDVMATPSLRKLGL